jgi:hypothetical protein
MALKIDSLCGIVVRVPAYRSRGPGFDSRRYQIFWEVMSLERDPLSLVSTTEEQLERNGSGSGLENREYGRRNPSRWPRGTLHPQMLALPSLTSGGRSVSIVRFRTKAIVIGYYYYYYYYYCYYMALTNARLVDRKSQWVKLNERWKPNENSWPYKGLGF